MHRLKQEIDSIKSESLKTLTKRCLERCPTTFWSIPASKSGLFHSRQSLGDGGLIQHTKMVCAIIPILCRAYDSSQEDMDEIIVAAILHDIHKPDYLHAIKTFQWLEANKEELQAGLSIPENSYTRIVLMVKYHMGRWTNKPHNKQTYKYTAQEWILHLADMVTTIKNIRVEF